MLRTATKTLATVLALAMVATTPNVASGKSQSTPKTCVWEKIGPGPAHVRQLRLQVQNHVGLEASAKAEPQQATHDGQWVAVEAVTDLNEVATVYNLRVSEYHTYFVGSREWGFSVWAHNTICGGAVEAAIRAEIGHAAAGRVTNLAQVSEEIAAAINAGNHVEAARLLRTIGGVGEQQATRLGSALAQRAFPGIGQFASEVRGAGVFEFTPGWSTRTLPGASNDVLIYTVVNRNSGQVLKVGVTTNQGAIGRWTAYRTRAAAEGIQVEIQYTRFSSTVPRNGANTPEALLRAEMRAQGHQLPWDSSGLQNTGRTPASFPEEP